jgi:hypothetical protein
MKFKILEKHGKFRISQGIAMGSSSTICTEGWLWWKTTEVTESYNPMQYQLLDHPTEREKYISGGPFTGTLFGTRPAALEFTSYKEAKNHIKKHFGLAGVKSIVQPDWRVV